MKPFKLTPAFKDYLWGGSLLRERYGKKSALDKIAESWELSCHKSGESVVADGVHAGKTLSALIAENPAILGDDAEKFENFPVLIKLIDAKDNLSVQVHPANDYALRVEGEYGKTEMWYVVECEPGASLIYGFNREIDKDEFRRRIEDNTLLEVVNQVPVRRGDVFFIEAGTLHAIGAGILIAEIQQNSDSTYRVYDYGRTGVDGKPRELHIEKALDVTVTAPSHRPIGPVGAVEHMDGYRRVLLGSCDYFTAQLLTIFSNASLHAGRSSFHALLCLSGEGTLRFEGGELAFGPGESMFVPAHFGDYTIDGVCELIETTV